MSDRHDPPLTGATIRELARTRSFERGQSYYEGGAVGEVVRRGGTVRATVEGSRSRTYDVTVEFDDAGVASTACSCPYDHGGICKHRVAVLLTVLRDPDRVRHERPVAERIADADRDILETLLVDLVESRPELVEWIAPRLDSTDDAAGTASAVSVDPESIRRRANRALPRAGPGSRGDGYAEAERMAEELEPLVEQARAALEAGDGETALDALEPVADEVAGGEWAGLLPHDATAAYEAIGELSDAFTEAILTADLTESEREEWQRRLDKWDEGLQPFVGGSAFAAAIDAADRGWDDERVRRAMAGELDAGAFRDETYWFAGDLVDARLAVLERQGRTEAYLNLAESAGRTGAHAQMLVEEGRIDEAVDYGTERLSTPDGFRALANTLREHGRTDAALTVAERGLSVEGLRKGKLAAWLRDRADRAGEADLALEAAVTAFEADPSLRAYRAVEELAGDDWATLREDLLEFLRDQDSGRHAASRHVEVFLAEGLYDDAIDLADRSGHADVVEPVVDAVVEERPRWAVDACKRQAEPIVEQGQHDSYRTAVRWLEKAGQAAEAAGELDEWREYVQNLRDEHSRKYKLRPMLDDLLEEF